MSPLDRDAIGAILDERPDLTDDAFTARVMGALPPPSTARAERLAPPRPRSGVLFAFAAAACALAYATVGSQVPRTLAAALVAPSSVIAMFTALAMVMVLGIPLLAAEE